MTDLLPPTIETPNEPSLAKVGQRFEAGEAFRLAEGGQVYTAGETIDYITTKGETRRATVWGRAKDTIGSPRLLVQFERESTDEIKSETRRAVGRALSEKSFVAGQSRGNDAAYEGRTQLIERSLRQLSSRDEDFVSEYLAMMDARAEEAATIKVMDAPDVAPSNDAPPSAADVAEVSQPIIKIEGNMVKGWTIEATIDGQTFTRTLPRRSGEEMIDRGGNVWRFVSATASEIVVVPRGKDAVPKNYHRFSGEELLAFIPDATRQQTAQAAE